MKKCHWVKNWFSSYQEHNFGKWIKIQEYTKYSWNREIGNGIFQQRQCKDCDYIELKNEEVEVK